MINQINPNTSDKIKVLSFFLIILVLYIHSGFHPDEIDGMNVNHFLQELISGKIGRLAVPLFFMISGFLFFQNTENGISIFKRKIKSRFSTLVIPYFIGCLFFFSFLISIELLGFGKYMNNSIKPFLNQPIYDQIIQIFWKVNNGNSPLAFHLWFLRDLIIIVLVTPILYYLLKYMHWIFIILIYFSVTTIDLKDSSTLQSLFWFSTGSLLAVRKININYQNHKLGFLLLIGYTIIFINELIFKLKLPTSVSIPAILIGNIGIWFTYNYFISKNFELKKVKKLDIACSFTFFIYLFHEPTLNIVRKIIVLGTGKTSFGYAISYLSSPFVLIFIAIGIGLILKKSTPKLYQITVGYRN